MLHKTILLTFLLFFNLSISVASPLEKVKVSGLLDTYFEVWKTRDINKIGELYADGVSVYDLPSNSTTVGKKAVIKFQQMAWLASVPDMVWIKTNSASILDNTATYEWVYSGTYTGDWWGQKIEDKTFSIKGMSSTTFNKDGKMVLQRDYYDIKSLEKQLGVK
jgi:steroid delta-isomerase-like uncharacterized protein